MSCVYRVSAVVWNVCTVCHLLYELCVQGVSCCMECVYSVPSVV